MICSAYNASKAGVIQLARNLAAEWGEHNIRVNTISPGYIVTAMVEDLFKQYPERRTDWPKQNMLGRLSAPREYRGAAVFLISDASSFMVRPCSSYFQPITNEVPRLALIYEWTADMRLGELVEVVDGVRPTGGMGGFKTDPNGIPTVAPDWLERRGESV